MIRPPRNVFSFRDLQRAAQAALLATFAVVFALLMPSSVTASASDGPLQRAIDALGGAEALASVSTVQIEASGETRVLFEDFTPEVAADANTYRRTYSVDFDQDLMRVDVTRQPYFEVFQFFPEQNFTLVADREIGHLSEPATFVPPGDLESQYVSALWRQQLLFNPQLVLAAAAENPDVVTIGGAADIDGRPHRILTIDNDVAPIDLYMDMSTALISRAVSSENNPLVRDVEIEVTYRDWQLGSGMPYPAQIELLSDGRSLWQEERTSFVTNQEFPADHFANLALADPGAYDPELADFGRQSQHHMLAFYAIGFTYPPENPIFGVNELAPGVHHVSAGTGSVIIEQSDRLVLLEAPLSPAYGSKLIEVAAEISDKPISHVVQSHHHVDHASGARSLVAAGADIVVGPGVSALWDRILTADSTVRPDALSEASVVGAVQQVGEGSSLTLDDVGNVVTAYHVSTPHARDMLVTTVDTGTEIFVINADLYNGGFGFTVALPGPRVLFDGLRTLGLLDAVCESELPMTLVSIHGIPLSLSEALAELDSIGVDAGCEQTCNGLTPTLVGTQGDDVLTGTSGRDVIVGLGGDDVIRGYRGNDVICGGNGNDEITGDGGSDVVLGGPGDDTISTGAGADWVDGGAGDDIIRGGPSADVIRGGSGADEIRGGSGDDEIDGDGGPDVMYGGWGDDVIDGGFGNDTAFGNGNTDTCIAETTTGCKDTGPLPAGVHITLRNTLEEEGLPETAFPGLFGLPDDAFDEFATLSNDVSEFPTALAQPDTPFGDISGLYDIDLTQESIDFTLLPAADDPFWVNVFEVFPTGKFDRYYLTFSEPHNISGFTSNNSSVALRIDSATVAVIEISEGYDMNPGTAFSIELN